MNDKDIRDCLLMLASAVEALRLGAYSVIDDDMRRIVKNAVKEVKSRAKDDAT